MSDKCVCYVNMTVEEMKRLPVPQLVEAIIGSIPIHYKEKQYMEVLKKIALSPGNRNKLLEILREKEEKSGFDEKEKATITKLHATNLYYTEEAVVSSLHEIIKSELYRTEKWVIELVKKVTLAREEGEKHWNDIVEDATLKERRLSDADDLCGYLKYVYTVFEIFKLSDDRLKEHARSVVEKDKKEHPSYCIKLSLKFGIQINAEEYAEIADEMLKNANSIASESSREDMAKKALYTYEALNGVGRLSVERLEILKEYQKQDVQHAIRKASKLLKNNFTYIPRGVWDRIF